ncbi:MAG: VPS10 domain-containing protein [Longimicrobiales bacterium]
MKRIGTLALIVSAFGGIAPAPATAQAPDLATTVSRLEYREIGPALMGGRIAALAVVESKPQMFYLGTASGGLWKTEDHGTSWTPLFDDQPTSSIGDVTIDQANPNLVWVGTGEPQNRQSSPWGNGVYKSMDGGENWAHMGLEETKHIARVLIHPRNPDVVYVAAVGDLWGPSSERGVFRTTDGGQTWENVLFIDEDTGAIDLAMDPDDPMTLFAAMYQRRRTGWGFNGGGPGSGLYRTMDGGANWAELTEGLPEGDKGRIGVDIFRQDGNVVYALIEADLRSASQGFGGGGGSSESGIFRSTDRGSTWEKMSDTNPRPMYYSRVEIDPSNSDRIYVLGSALMVSDDAGKTFRSDGATQIHVDHHALWINPKDPDHLILGSDGGVSASWDGTGHWRMFDNLALGQFYTISYDMRDPYAVCGGLQDNNPWCGPSNTRSFHGIRNQDWYETAYGDGFWTVVDPTDSTIVFSESQGGNMNRYDLITGEKTPMRPITGPRENGDTAKAYRFNWNAPLLISQHDPATIYLGGNYLMRSRDRGMSWEEVGGVDLTKQIDRAELEIMGVPGSEPMMSIHDGTSTYGNLTTLAESRFTPDVIYAGTDDGNFQVTMDGGDTWENVVDRIPGLPERTYVSRVAPSAHAEGRIYATFDGHRNGDYSAYVYVSENYGKDWKRIDDGLPHGWSVNVITEHHRAPNLLFVGNEIGVYFSIDRGESWTQLKNNLPVVPVDDIAIHPRENDLIVGTHGRSAWIMADVAPLEHLSQSVMAQPGHVFPLKATVMWAQMGDWPFYGATYSAPNPPRATPIRYYVRDEGAEEHDFSVEITDSSGATVRTFDGPAEPGVNEILWDWRHDAPYEARAGEGGGGGRGRGGGTPQGPIVMPGQYTVTLHVGEDDFSSTMEIQADPRRSMTVADRQARQDALMSLNQLAAPLFEVTQAAQRLTDQMEEAESLLEEYEGGSEALTETLVEIQEELEAVRTGLDEARAWAGVGGAIQGSSTLPTEDQLWQVDAAWQAVPPLVERFNVLIEISVPAFNGALDAEGVRPDPGTPLTVPVRGGD